ncbi:helix-turn-helix domain-containing protein, partial [Streptomyces sp. TRM72054]|uniref:helix-turn-helix domain-containing protein n=1 Tax=Streptomyces sp. TRM72054 TaxID=2870562 RepID=UPI0021AB3DED
MTENLTIGERVAWYRRRRGLSQEVLAGLVGRTTDWLSKAENNRIELDRVSVITSLAEALASLFRFGWLSWSLLGEAVVLVAGW